MDEPDASGRPSIAVFDFDGTLTVRDSMFPFLRMAATPYGFLRGMGRASPALVRHAVGLLSNQQAKETLLGLFLSGISTGELECLGRRFAREVIPGMLRQAAVQRLLWHIDQGHDVWLASASLEAYVRPWAESLGCSGALGTRLEAAGGLLTGRILGLNCRGPEKVERLRQVLGDLTQYRIFAYGDSRGDRELLSIAEYPMYRRFIPKRERAVAGSAAIKR
jgi:HAD superfamily hydrolase (TIGR01490 family)